MIKNWKKGNPVISGGHFYPPADNTYDLGSVAKSWRNIYVDSLIYVTSTVMQGDFWPSLDDTYDVGSSALAWTDAHFDGVVYTDDILEHTSAHGVEIDGVTLKDNNIYLASGGVIDFNTGDVTLTHSANMLTVASTWSTVNAVGQQLVSSLTTDVRLGSYVNAIYGYVDLQATGGVTGLLGAICGEVVMPTGLSVGTIACLELELTCPSSGFDGTRHSMSYIFFNTTGTTNEGFNDYGVLLHFDVGNVAATGNIVGASYSTLRIGFGQQYPTLRYIPLSTAEASFTTAYPIALTNTLTVGVSDTGHDVKFWGATASHYMLWDESADELVIKGRISFLEDTSRTGEGTYLFGDGGGSGLNIGMTSPGDCQGIKMEFKYGVSPTLSGDGKNVHGLDIKMTMDQEWNFTSNDRNAVIRGARIQGWSQNDVGGKVMGIYSNARAEGTSKTVEGIIGGNDDGPGVVSIEARTELGSSATITTPDVVGLEIWHNSKTGAELTGDYKAIVIHQPLMPTITGTMYGIWFGDDHNTGYPYDYAFGFSTELDLDQVAHHNAGFSTTGSGAVDGWIKVEVDGNPLYIYLWNTTPS